MPTGYTADIAKGITFEQFALGCARAFGALITMRDEPTDTPIPDRFEPSPYDEEMLTAAKAEVARIRAMTDAECAAAAKAEFQKATADHERRFQEKNELRAKYDAMLAQVEAWAPPTADHEPMKEFMVSQIKESIDSDCDNGFYECRKPVEKSGVEWRDAKLESAGRDVVYHARARAQEYDRVENRNRWVAALRKSLRPAETVRATESA